MKICDDTTNNFFPEKILMAVHTQSIWLRDSSCELQHRQLDTWAALSQEERWGIIVLIGKLIKSNTLNCAWRRTESRFITLCVWPILVKSRQWNCDVGLFEREIGIVGQVCDLNLRASHSPLRHTYGYPLCAYAHALLLRHSNPWHLKAYMEWEDIFRTGSLRALMRQRQASQRHIVNANKILLGVWEIKRIRNIRRRKNRWGELSTAVLNGKGKWTCCIWLWV